MSRENKWERGTRRKMNDCLGDREMRWREREMIGWERKARTSGVLRVLY